MATGEQVKSLIRSHFGNDSERFYTVALQVAAHEARQGHGALAVEIRDLVDRERHSKSDGVRTVVSDLHGLVLTEEADTPKSALVIPTSLSARIDRIIREYRQRHKLEAYGLDHRRKILLIGPPGTGKTMTAHVLAKELHLTLHTIQMDRLLTKFMGESSAKLRLVFEMIQRECGAYLFDEFDAIGGERASDSDVGEMRRVLNAFLQLIDQDRSDSLIIAATNIPKLLDRALSRRFNDVLRYEVPQPADRKRLIANVLGCFLAQRFTWKQVIEQSEGLSHAEIDHACRDAIKDAILSEQSKVTAAKLLPILEERRGVDHGLEG